MYDTSWMSVALSACSLTALLFAITPHAHASDHRSAPVPVLSWAACSAESPDAECAVARVPLDYDEPRGATTSIVLAKIPAADPANKIGTVFLNPGGPGGSGTDFVLAFGNTLARLLHGRFDVVGFSVRGGEGALEPLQCFGTEADRAAFLARLPALFPYQRQDRPAFFEIYQSFAGRCFARGQAIAAHMSTADVARDLDLLRQAVGDDRLSYLGFSYGSHLGNTYANLFPSKVRALVIDGVIDPRQLSRGRQFASVMSSTALVFDEFLRLCDEAGPACAFNDAEGPGARFDALGKSLRDAPLVGDDGTVLYDYANLIADTSRAMNAPDLWPAYAQFLDALAEDIAGLSGAAQRMIQMRSAVQSSLAEAAPQPMAYNNALDAYFGIICSDSPIPSSFAAFNAIADFAQDSSIFGLYWWGNSTPCGTWPISKDRYLGPWSTRTAAPVLIVGNYFDSNTGYDGAVATHRLLKNSRLLSYAGWGHTAFNRSECVARYVEPSVLQIQALSFVP
jgi:pimeloyl-ACP methyl ester carboxylesterase